MSDSCIPSLQSVINRFGLENVPGEWYRSWDSSMDSYPDDGPEFLDHGFLKAADEFLLLPEKALAALFNAASVISEDEGLSRLIWHCSRSIFSPNELPDPSCCYFPSLGKRLGEYSDLFGVLVLLSGLPKLLELHRQRDIPRQVTMDTLADMKLWMKDYFEKHGRWGLEQNRWLIYHFTGRLFQLGRLQFAFGAFKGDIKVFRNIGSGKIVAFSEADVVFRKDGLVNGTNGIYETKGLWTAAYKADGRRIRGNRVLPDGTAVKQRSELPADRWKPVLSKGDNVLDVHIPAGEKMHLDACGLSFNAAREFFQRHFPEYEYAAYACRTWLFDTQFLRMLAPSSNIVRFQREFYIYPVQGSDFQAFERVFGHKPEDLSRLPADTALRKAILEHYAKGGWLKDMGGFILKGDLDWGKRT